MRVTLAVRLAMPRSSTPLLRKNYKITDFPLFKETYGKRSVVVEISPTRGCDIAHELLASAGRPAIFSTSVAKEDVANISTGKKIILQISNAGERTPANVRGMAFF